MNAKVTKLRPDIPASRGPAREGPAARALRAELEAQTASELLLRSWRRSLTAALRLGRQIEERRSLPPGAVAEARSLNRAVEAASKRLAVLQLELTGPSAVFDLTVIFGLI